MLKQFAPAGLLIGLFVYPFGGCRYSRAVGNFANAKSEEISPCAGIRSGAARASYSLSVERRDGWLSALSSLSKASHAFPSKIREP